MIFKSPFSVLIQLTLVLLSTSGMGQATQIDYIDPLPGADYIMPATNLIFTSNQSFHQDDLKKINIDVTGSKSGRISGEINLINSGRTIQFEPDHAFITGEIINVAVTGRDGLEVNYRGQKLKYHFHITPEVVPVERILPFIQNECPGYPWKNHKPEKCGGLLRSGKDESLPEDFPVIEILNDDHPAESGYYFMAPMNGWVFPDAKPYIVIFDRYGTPLFYKKHLYQNSNLQVQTPGLISYFEGFPEYCFQLLDQEYNLVDSYRPQNGYTLPDHHEFILTDDGHAFILIYDPQMVGMDTVVPGGHPNATVTGFVFQELDEEKNVVFQWRSWDHFQITDATEHEDLTDSIIDYVHGNSIEIVNDSSLIISCRNMSEITKIDRVTGEIIWRLGGRNNMFEFIGDTLGFSYQHDARILSNGNLSLFDNGSHHDLDTLFSSVIEYEIDEENLTATLVRRLRNDPDILGVIMGNAQEKEDGRMVVGWGSGVPAITEFLADGTKAFEVYVEAFNYRAYRYNWKPGAFTFPADSLDCGEAHPGSQVTAELIIQNNRDEEVEINNVVSHSSYFRAPEGSLPLIIPPLSSETLDISFLPDTLGPYDDLLTICSDMETDEQTYRIANQVHVFGQGMVGGGFHEAGFERLITYPNPTRDGMFYIRWESNINMGPVKIYSVHGNFLKEQEIKDGNMIDISDLPAGIYYIELGDRDLKAFGKVVKL